MSHRYGYDYLLPPLIDTRQQRMSVGINMAVSNDKKSDVDGEFMRRIFKI